MTTAAPVADWRDAPASHKRRMLRELRRRRKDAARRRYPTPGALAKRLDDSTRNPPHLVKIDEKLVRVADGDCKRLLITMPPQEGKSERTSHYGALWFLLQNPELRIAIASYEQETARRWGQVIRNDLVTYRLGLELQEDSRAAARWNVAGHRGGVYCVGIGGALTGRAVDVLLIDDPVKDRAQADSEAARKAAWDWWTDVARTRLAPHAPVILIMTRWHDDDLAGRILANDSEGEWEVLHIPAVADHDPERGETDPIGRQPGEPLPSARQWEPGRWESVRRDVGERSWNALYQGRPAPAEGDIWLRSWWRFYDEQLWDVYEDGSCTVPWADEVLQSWDMTFKDTRGTDFVVGQTWAVRGAEAYLVDQVRARMNFPVTVDAVVGARAKWPQTTTVLVEDKANGSAVIDSLRRTVPGLIAVNPKESKQARASAAAPFIEARNVGLPTPRLAPWVAAFVDEAAAFPNGTHDDQVDCASQALQRIFLARRARLIV